MTNPPTHQGVTLREALAELLNRRESDSYSCGLLVQDIRAEIERFEASHPPAPEQASGERAKLSAAPCDRCGYNGPGYYQPDTHPCAAAHHAAEDATPTAEPVGEPAQQHQDVPSTLPGLDVVKPLLSASPAAPEAAEPEPKLLQKGFAELVAERRAAKAEQQAQAGEPEVVGWVDEFGNVYPKAAKRGPSWVNEHQKNWKEVITLQAHREAMAELARGIQDDWELDVRQHREAMAELARGIQDDWELDVRQHREAIAKKDAALKACVTALQDYRKPMHLRTVHEEDAAGEALILAQEALK